MTPPETRYARSSDLRIAYQVVGAGPVDVVFVPGFVSNIDLFWEMPEWANFFSRLAAFSRLILFDKRGTGLSDRIAGVANLEERMDDVRAVMDAAGSQRAALFGASEGGPMSLLFAATYPQAEIFLMGVEEPKCQIHAPNESVDPSEIENMAVTEALFLQRYADAKGAS